LDLRDAHAAARDAVRTELDLERQLGTAFVNRWRLFEVSTRAKSKDEYLLKPNLGRSLCDASRSELMTRCPRERDLQIVIGDGLSVTAVAAQVPMLLPALYEGAQSRGWTLGNICVVRHCRVGILNEVGELLAPQVAVLLIGERPGLATAESLSAYMAYRPNKTHTDAGRNLISNIHARGISPPKAAAAILQLAAQMMAVACSGTQLKAEPLKQAITPQDQLPGESE
jgi:ethanolamine ammonia-lyase small subunit